MMNSIMAIRFPAASRQKGFTIIEVVVAMTMASAMAMLFIPRIQDGLQRNAVRSARAAASTQVARARSVAASRGCPSTVHFAAGSNSRVWITSCPLDGNSAVVDTVGTVDALGDDRAVSLTTTSPSISFAPTGVATASSWTYLTFSYGEYTQELKVSPLGKTSW